MRILVRFLIAAALVGVTSFGIAAQTVTELFNPDVIQDVRLSINSRDLFELRQHFNLNTTYPVDWTWRNQRLRNVSVRSRGNGSRNPFKLGLLAEFNRYTSGQTFLGRRSIVLDNLWQDPSMVRERLAMTLFARMGVASPLEAPARLFINNEYQGVYGLVESIDADFLVRNGLDPAGTLYEYHFQRPYYFEDLGDDLSAYAALFEPRTHQTDGPAALYGPLRDMVSAINEPSETLWRDRVEASVDLEQLLTLTAVESFLSEFDGVLGYEGLNNFYVYRAPGATRHQFLPWDRDNAFQATDDSIFRRVDQNPLIARALTYPDLYEFYLRAVERTALLAAEDDFLFNQVQAAVSQIDESAAADTQAPYTPDERAGAIAHLFDFAHRRPGVVLRQVIAARAAIARR